MMACPKYFLLLLLFCGATLKLSSAIRGERRRVHVQTTSPPLNDTKGIIKCQPLKQKTEVPVANKLGNDYSSEPTLTPTRLAVPTLSTPSDTSAASSPSAAKGRFCTDVPSPLLKDPKSKKGEMKGGKGRKADCLALSKGLLPEKYENSVDGILTAELLYRGNNTEVLADIGNVLRKDTSAEVAGCPKPNRQLQNTTDSAMGTNESLPIMLGVNFSDLTIEKACLSPNKTFDCSEVRSNVAILYDGEANATEKAAMFLLVRDTIVSQEAEGLFKEIVALSALRVEPGDNTSTVNTATSEQRAAATSTWIVVGVVLFTVGLAVISFFAYRYIKKISADTLFTGEAPQTGVAANDKFIPKELPHESVVVKGRAI